MTVKIRYMMAFISLMAAASLVPGCSTRGGSTYTPEEAGRVMEATSAMVVSSRKVTIEGLRGDAPAGWGTAVGAAVAGAAAYGLTEADTPLGVAVTIIASVGGALVGTVVEEQKNRYPGGEYILRSEGREPFAVVQTLINDEKILPAGARVVVLRSRNGLVRVVPDKK